MALEDFFPPDHTQDGSIVLVVRSEEEKNETEAAVKRLKEVWRAKFAVKLEILSFEVSLDVLPRFLSSISKQAKEQRKGKRGRYIPFPRVETDSFFASTFTGPLASITRFALVCKMSIDSRTKFQGVEGRKGVCRRSFQSVTTLSPPGSIL